MENSIYSFSLPRLQHFSLPIDVILCLIKNSVSIDGFLKLQQTCKYFPSKNKIIILNKWVYSDSNSFYYLNNGKQKLKEESQYWLTFNLQIKPGCCIPKCIYRCSLKSLEIRGKNMTFKEICFLLNGEKIEYLDLLDANIEYENGKAITLDVILQKCPKIKKLFYSNLCETFSNETFMKILKIKLFNKLENLELIISNINEFKMYASIFREFLQHFVDKNSIVNIWFKCKFDNFGNFRATIKKKLQDFWTKNLTINHDFS